MSGWNRKRHPDDVPTPVAVAVADFCRRAQAPASPAVVREALSLLGDADDRAVRAVTDAAPAASPLGPFAVVDIVKGTRPALAAERHASGYYELVRLAASDDADAPAPAPAPAPRPRASAPKRAQAAKPRTPKPRRLTVSDKIAPTRRPAGAARPSRAKPEQPLPGTAFLPKRNLPAPRGRFTRVDPSRSTFEALLKPAAKDALEAIAGQSPTRFHVFLALEPGYVGRSGKPLSVPEVEEALVRHGLLDGVAARERDQVLAALGTARGSVPAAARELGVRPADVDRLVAELRLKREVGEVREQFVREALDPSNLALRLNLLGRQRYLADLKIEKKFADALSRDLTKLLDDCAEAASSLSELIELAAKKHALVPDLLNRAVDRLGLTARYVR